VEPGALVAGQVPDDDQDGTPDRDDGFLLATAAGDAPAAFAQERVGSARPDGCLAQDPGQLAVAVTGGSGALLTARGFLDAGGEHGYAARCAGMGKWVMSAPTSAMITRAAVAPIPGISSRRDAAPAAGAIWAAPGGGSDRLRRALRSARRGLSDRPPEPRWAGSCCSVPQSGQGTTRLLALRN